jgi:hypothetical protein
VKVNDSSEPIWFYCSAPRQLQQAQDDWCDQSDTGNTSDSSKPGYTDPEQVDEKDLAAEKAIVNE